MKRKAKGKQIGFFMQSPDNFFQNPIQPQNPMPNQFNNPNQLPSNPFEGLNGFVQNAQQMIGLYNQVKPLLSGLSPLLSLFQGRVIDGDKKNIQAQIALLENELERISIKKRGCKKRKNRRLF